VTVTLSTDSGAQISSLVLPLSQKDYFTLSAEELSQQYIAPYLDSLKTDGVLWEGICRSGAGVTTQNEHGPA
jgi:hypothetical protein